MNHTPRRQASHSQSLHIIFADAIGADQRRTSSPSSSRQTLARIARAATSTCARGLRPHRLRESEAVHGQLAMASYTSLGGIACIIIGSGGLAPFCQRLSQEIGNGTASVTTAAQPLPRGILVGKHLLRWLDNHRCGGLTAPVCPPLIMCLPSSPRPRFKAIADIRTAALLNAGAAAAAAAMPSGTRRLHSSSSSSYHSLWYPSLTCKQQQQQQPLQQQKRKRQQRRQQLQWAPYACHACHAMAVRGEHALEVAAT